ncbi:hypothetical protein KJ636_03280 [Patescibacteria group bacterium]|nr:hypothetical protein [Patescibacteria group bacterium]
MAITFQEKERKQRYWIFVFIIIIFAVFFVFRSDISQKKTSLPLTTYKPPKIEINFEVLKNPFLKELLPYEEIKPFQEKVGRENPFLPY